MGLRPENALLRTRFFVTFLAMKKVKKKRAEPTGVLYAHKAKNLSFCRGILYTDLMDNTDSHGF